MIIRSYEFNKINLTKYNLFHFYGKNHGLKNEIIFEFFLKNFDGTINKYDEEDFIKNNKIILSEIVNKSLFESKKILIISRSTDKLVKYINEILEINLSDVKLIFVSDILEKRSKLRNLFEKQNNTISIPFYDDNSKILSELAIKFLNSHNIKLSRETINLLVDRASGDRNNLNTELNKIYNFSITNKNITFENVQKLSNLAEDHDLNELTNNILSKRKKNIAKILNENNYSDEDCILIIRTILSKSKRLLSIIEKLKENKNLEEVLSEFRPPIFWKEKEAVKKQANSWELKDLRNKIYQINEIETLVKSKSKSSLNLLSDFIINF